MNEPSTPATPPAAGRGVASITEMERRAAAAAPAAVASFEARDRGFVTRLRHTLHSHPTAIPAFVLLLAVAGFSAIVGDRFLTPFNMSLILQQVAIIAILGVAQTLIVLTAGIDLSVGAIMVLCSVVMGKLAVQTGLPTPLAILVAFAVGGFAGFCNGVLVTRFRLPPFIVTLGTWNILFALNLWYSASETIRSQDIAAEAPMLQWFGTAIEIGGARLTYGAIMVIILFACAWYALERTPWGKHLYATGDDRDAAQLAGIRTEKVLLSAYVAAGLICALAAWVLIGRIGSVSPQAGQTANLDSITAVVIGGISLFGGRGAIIGTLLGALIVGVFRNGLALSGVAALWQEFAIGVLIIVAVAVDQWLRRVAR
jgi:fructose transport system permease protein